GHGGSGPPTDREPRLRDAAVRDGEPRDGEPRDGTSRPSIRHCDPLASFQAPVPIPLMDGANYVDEAAFFDDSTIYFSARVKDTGNWDLYESPGGLDLSSFGAATPLAGLNTTDDDRGPILSPDGLTLFFVRNADIYYATRTSRSEGFSLPK